MIICHLEWTNVFCIYGKAFWFVFKNVGKFRVINQQILLLNTNCNEVRIKTPESSQDS